MSGQYMIGKKGFITTMVLQNLDNTWGQRLWEPLAKILDVPGNTIEKLKFNLYRQKLTYRDVMEDILLDWLYRNKSEATIDNFLSIIRQHDELKKLEHQVEHSLSILSKSETLKVGWKKLETGIKGEILSKEIVFCGERKQLIDIAGNMSAEVFINILEDTIHGQLLWDLMSDNLVVVIESTIPKCVPWYIPRTIMTRTLVDPQILLEKTGDIFLLKGIEWSVLSLMTGFQPSDTSENQLKSVNVQFIILTNDSHFALICGKTKNPVHVLEYKHKKFKWVKSHGDCRSILDFLSGEYENITEADIVNKHFSNHQNSTICISDCPGSGKSELLASLAKGVQTMYNERLVIFFHMSQILRILKDSGKFTCDPSFVKEFIAKTLSRNELGYRIIIEAFTSGCYQIELFCDALDELYEDDDTKLCCQFLKSAREFQNVRLCIATGVSPILDIDDFNAFLYRIKPFSNAEQIRFISNYWSYSCNAEQNFGLSSFAQNCLKFRNFYCLENTEQIAGIPLQCVMLADIYSKSAKQISCVGIYRNNKVQRELTLFELYKNYMRDKFTHSEVQEELCCTINLLFPQISNYLFESSSSQIRKRYSHKTLAEYAISKSIINLISILSEAEIESDSIIEESKYLNLHRVLQLIFKTNSNEKFVYGSLCFFLNEMIQDTNILNKSNVHTIILRVLYHQTFKSKDMKLTFMKACSLNKLYGIYCLFLGDAKKIFEKESLTIWEWKNILLTATKYANLSLVKNVLELLNCVGDMTLLEVEFKEFKLYDIYLTPLHVAAQRGCLQTFELFAHLYETRLNKMKSLVHVTVHNTLCDKEDYIMNKIQLVKLLIQKFGADVLSYEIENKLTPLLMDRIHIKLVRLLITEGANPYTRCSNLFTFAHKAALYMNPSKFHEFVEFVIENQYDRILRFKNYKDESPFEIATKQIRLESGTIDLIASSLASTLEDEMVYRDNFLYHLIRNDYKSTDLHLALRYDSGWVSFKYKDSSTTILHVAVEEGNMDALSFLLSMGADPNVVDHTGKTPLHIACFQQGNSKCPASVMSEIVKVLINNGADVNVTDREGRQPLTFILDTL